MSSFTRLLAMIQLTHLFLDIYPNPINIHFV